MSFAFLCDHCGKTQAALPMSKRTFVRLDAEIPVNESDTPPVRMTFHFCSECWAHFLGTLQDVKLCKSPVVDYDE